MSDVIERAEQSLGSSSDAVYQMVRGIVRECEKGCSCDVSLLDVGCGHGNLYPFVADFVATYAGVDVMRYEGFPIEHAFYEVNLDTGRVQLADASADLVVAVETIEHLENPRAFVRELVRLCKPGGWVIITTPNQLSLLSKLTLLLKNQFNAFTDSSYPAHITALLESDLQRIAKECGAHETLIRYSEKGRIPGGSWNWPKAVSRLSPRSLSDNVAVAFRI